MTPIVKHHRYMSQINTSPVYPETIIYLREVNAHVLVYQNDQLITLISAPIMKVVRAIRNMYVNPNIELI